MNLLSMIERHLAETGLTPSRFGRDALGDPGFVKALRNGREPRESTVRRVTTHIRARQTAR